MLRNASYGSDEIRATATSPEAALGFPSGAEAAGQHPGQPGFSLGTAISLEEHSHTGDLLSTLQPVYSEPSRTANCLLLTVMSRGTF